MKKQVRVMLLGAVLAAPAAAFARAPAQWPEEGYTYRDYRQDGLVAQWDAKNTCGPGAPLYGGSAAAHTWVDLVAARKLTCRNDNFTNELGPRRATGSTYWAKMTTGTCDFLKPREEGVTVEVAFSTCNSTCIPLFFGPRESGIAIGKNYNPGGLVAGYDGMDEGTRPMYTWNLNRSYDKQPAYASLSICYTNGHVDLDHSYMEGTKIALNGSTFTEGTYAPDTTLRVMSSAGKDSWCGVRIHAIRVYHGKLTADEVERHRQIDRKRYCQEDYYAANRLFYAFTVKSGSVTVGGTAYAAGDFVYYRNDVAVPVEAENAVIVPRKDGAAKIELVSGQLTIETADAGAMPYVAALAIDAGATLNVSATGLNAAALTAEDGATATGTGPLIATSATAPVAYANYRCANETFAGWPSGGTAYIPAGTNLAITASTAAALNAIVFMDDGTDAAKTTTVSYTESSALTLKARLAGHGIFSAATTGKLTITGDSRNFTGRFVFDDVNALVTHPYGLGFEGSEMSEIAVGANGYCHFDDGTDVFTNHAPIRIWSKDAKNSACNAIIGSESLSKTLVQAGEFENNELDAGGSGYNPQQKLYIQNNLTLLKGWFCYGVYGKQLMPNLYLLNPGRFALYGHKLSESWSGATISPSKGAEAAEFVNGIGNGDTGGWYLCGNMTFGALNVLNCQAKTTISSLAQPCIQISGSYPNSVVDLNGYDQYFGSFNVSEAKAAWAQDLTVTSAVPATVTLVESKNVTMRIPFRGAASLTYAMNASQTNKLSAVVSDTTGTLTVESGRLELANGYRWLGKKVCVTGGELVVSDTAQFGKKTCLYVEAEDGAAVTLPDDGEITVRALKVDGVWKAAGTYGGAAALAAGKIDADHTLACFGTESTGVLVVKRNTGDPQGLVMIVR